MEGRAKPPIKWLGILNLVFAIGCRFCRLNGSIEDDDLVYLTRARKLSLNDTVLFDHPDLQQIQVEGLVAFYLLTMGQINLTSKFSSMAIRSALALGINMRFVDTKTQHASKEARSRLWWSIFTLEHLLTAITGRASAIGQTLSSLPMPIPFEEETFSTPDVARLFEDDLYRASRLKPTIFQIESEVVDNQEWLADVDPSPSLFFYCLVDLAMITQEVINKVYSIEGTRDRSTQIERRIQRYGDKMDDWRAKIPDMYKFDNNDNPENPPRPPVQDAFDVPTVQFAREKTCLALHYFSARITLCRPCLSTAHPGQASRSQTRIEAAISCLHSACSLVAMLPDDMDIIWVTEIMPWWATLQFLMQATTALLLGIAAWPIPPGWDRSDMTLDAGEVVGSTKKALRWLHRLAGANASSRRAFILCDSFIRRIRPSLEVDTEDLPHMESFLLDTATRVGDV